MLHTRSNMMQRANEYNKQTWLFFGLYCCYLWIYCENIRIFYCNYFAFHLYGKKFSELVVSEKIYCNFSCKRCESRNVYYFLFYRFCSVIVNRSLSLCYTRLYQQFQWIIQCTFSATSRKKQSELFRISCKMRKIEYLLRNLVSEGVYLIAMNLAQIHGNSVNPIKNVGFIAAPSKFGEIFFGGKGAARSSICQVNFLYHNAISVCYSGASIIST